MGNKENYDWYEEDFTSFLLSLSLPAYRKDIPLKEALLAEKESFVVSFKEMISRHRFMSFSNAFYADLSAQLPHIKTSFDLLYKIVNYYNRGDMAGAQRAFDTLMDILSKHLFIFDITWPDFPSSFYRVRISKNSKLTKPKDLFHIPYDKRYLVSNERYSLAGHPCLYLASALQIAWQECGYPQQCYYSEFKYQRSGTPESEWRFITFLTPRQVATRWFVAKSDEDECKKIAISYLMSYPLIFACSIVNLNGHSAFKQEFIVPQMLMQWVLRNYDAVKGVKYFSCYDTDSIRHYSGFNVVMPAVIKGKQKKYSKDLKEKFKVSKPVPHKICFTHEDLAIINRYKNDLLVQWSSAFPEALECLHAIYNTTDLLDSAAKNMETANMQFVLSAVRSVIINGRMIYEKYSKESIINSGRKSITYTARTEAKIESFTKLYKRFQTDIIEIAESFIRKVDIMPAPTAEKFYTIR